MIIEDIHPELKTCSMGDLVKKIPVKYAVLFSNELAEYYDSKLNIIDVYNYYGVGIRTRIGHQFQVACLLPTHGSRDEHSSARYYDVDRNTGEVRPRIFCFKCGKLNTLFWYVFRIEEANGLKFVEFFDFLYRFFRIEFPREIFLKLDPEIKYIMESDSANDLCMSRMNANRIRALKYMNPTQYLQELKNLL